MSIDEIMALALEMAEFAAFPEDLGIFVEGRGIRRVLFGVDLILAHQPPGSSPDVWKVYLRGQIAKFDHTPSVARACFEDGVDTAFDIHIDGPDLQRLRADGRGNLIVTGHLAGDSLGFTPFLAALRSRGLEVTTFSGGLEPAP